MTRFRELPQSAQERIRSLPSDAKDLYFAAKDVARAYETGYMAGDFTQLVFWKQFLDAIAAIEDPLNEEQIPW